MARARQNRFDLETFGIQLDEERVPFHWGGVGRGRRAGGVGRPGEGADNDQGSFRIVTYADEETLPYAGGFRIPRRFWALWNLEAKITLYLGVEEGELVCYSVLVSPAPGGPPLSTTLMRRINVSRLIQETGARAAHRIDEEGNLHLGVFQGPDEWQRAVRAEGHVPRRGKRLGDEHYQRVAAEYKAALASGQPPTQAVAKTLHTARSNAGRWVMEARRRGFLGEAPAPGQPGERKGKRGKRR